MLKTKTRGQVLDALLHELLKWQTFDSMADLADTLKCAAARLKIPYDSASVTAAITAVARVRPVLRQPPHYRVLEPDPNPITRDEAIDLLARLFALKARRG